MLTFALSLFFLLFFGVIVLGNKISHEIERITAKEVTEKLAEIDAYMESVQENKE